MPSLRELFGPDGGDGLDLDEFMAEAERVVSDSAERQQATIPREEEQPSPEVSVPPAEVATGEPAAEDGGGLAHPPPPVPAAEDPFASLPPERRRQLLALDEIMQRDPAVLDRALQPAPQAQAPEPPRLPEEIDPQSFEAHLWQQNQQILGRLDELQKQQADQRQSFEQTRAQQAAAGAGQSFAARYQGKLTQDDVLAIAQYAGTSGLAGRLATGRDDLQAAYEEALEHVLWTNENWREKVTTPISGIPVTPPPVTETPPAPSPMATAKRTLTALSSAASPVSGPPPTRSALEARPDGRLTEQSRSTLVNELAASLRQGGGAN